MPYVDSLTITDKPLVYQHVIIIICSFDEKANAVIYPQSTDDEE